MLLIAQTGEHLRREEAIVAKNANGGSTPKIALPPAEQDKIRRASKARRKTNGGRSPRSVGGNLLNAMAAHTLGHHGGPGYTTCSGATPQALKAMHRIAG